MFNALVDVISLRKLLYLRSIVNRLLVYGFLYSSDVYFNCI